MIRINDNYMKLQASYLFADIAKKVESFQTQNPDREIIRLGIGDVTRALPAACIDALHNATKEMAQDETFRGYGPDQGYQFLREKIAAHDYQSRNADIDADEIFISDGAKCDTGNIQEIFATDIQVAVPDPVYPVYVDTNVMAGRTGNFNNGRFDGLIYLDCTHDNNYVPQLPSAPVDLIYLCFPNNPTGATITKEQLKTWIDFARDTKAIILYDAAYEAFIRDEQIPRSIFEVEGARQVAIEFRSFSKTAGFTGTRCAFTVVPKELMAQTGAGKTVSVHDLWNRRQATKFNSVSYPIQRAAEAVYSTAGQKQIRELTDYYLHNATYIREAFTSLGYDCVGGDNSPYIWINGKTDSWNFFDLLLEKAGVVCTPGAGFGKCGQNYIRISAFNSLDNVKKAMQQIQTALT